MMNTSKRWAILSLAGLTVGGLAGCTVTTTNGANDAGVGGSNTSTSSGTTTTGATTTTTGATGTTGSTTDTTGATTATGSSTGATTGGVVTPCGTCANTKCGSTVTACAGKSACQGAVGTYYMCLSATGITPAGVDNCGMDFLSNSVDADPTKDGTSEANDLLTCMTGENTGGDHIGCTATCSGGDAG